MRKITMMFIAFLSCMIMQAQEALITGYVDSPCSGANGRTIEIYVNGTIDFTDWDLVRQSNGGGYSSNIDLTDLGELTDTFAYITNDATVLEDEFGITSNVITNGGISDNGDDAFQLTDASSTVIDRFGEDGVDGSGTAWEHEDSYYYRNSGASANGGTFDVANWTIGALNLLDGEGTCSGGDALSTLVPFGTYVSVLTPPGETCDAPIEITSLPYLTSDDTANYGNDYNNGDAPCSNYYLSGDDVVYSFTPATDMVVNILMNNIGSTWSGIHVLDACLDSSPNCVAFEGNSTSSDRNLEGVLLSGGTTYYIIISTWATPQSTTYDLSIEQVLCPDPSAVTVDNITSNSADVSWTEGLSETEWEIIYGEPGFDPTSTGTTINDNDSVLGETIPDLTPVTEYDVYVRAVCSTDESSEWVGPVNFTTEPLCDPASGLNASEITPTSAILSWDAGDASDWEIAVQPYDSGEPESGEAVDTNSYTATLETGSTYEFYVRVDCPDVEGFSPWAGPFVFGGYSPIEALTGLSDDVIANGVGAPSTTTTNDLDGVNYVYMSEDYQNVAEDDLQGFGLPANGTLQSNSVPGLTYQMAPFDDPYNGNNSLRIETAGEANGGTLTFADVPAANILYLMVTSGSGSSELSGTITFDDTSTQEIAATSVPDWYNGSSLPTIISGIGRINLDSEDVDNPSNNPRIYQLEIPVDQENVNKSIVSISLYKSAGDGVLNVFGASIQFTPSCFVPINVNVENLTLDSVNITWEAVGDETEWEIIYGEAGFDPQSEGTSIVDNDGTIGETISGLEMDSEFDVYVRAICGEGDESALSNVNTFNTPYCQPNFTNNTEPITLVQVAGIDNTTDATLNGTPEIEDFTSMTAEMEQGGSYPIALEGNTDGNYEDFFTVFIDWNQNGALDDDGEVYEIGSVDQSTGTDGQQATGNIVVPVDAMLGDTRMRVYKNFNAFIAGPCTNTGYGQIEDYTVTVLESTVACSEPTNLAVGNITTTGADITWDAGDAETEWTVAYGDPGFDPANGEGTTVTDDDGSTGLTLDTLTENTSYDVYVQAVCGADDESEWVGPVNFTTESDTVDDGSECGQSQVSNDFENGLFMEEGGQLLANDFIVSSNTETFTANTITANILSNGGVASYDIIFYNDDNGTPGTEIQTIEDVVPTSQDIIGDAFGYDVYETVIDLPTPVAFAGDGVNEVTYWMQLIAVPNTAGNQVALETTSVNPIGEFYYFDNENVDTWTVGDEDGVFTISGDCEYIDGCLHPEGLAVGSITDTTAELTWSELGDATEWEIVYGQLGFNPDEEGTSVTDDDGTEGTTIDQLSPQTQYEVYVRAVCGEGDESQWEGPISFTTNCATITDFPFTETFEDDSESRDCWTNEYMSAEIDWQFVAQNGNSTIFPRTGDLMAEYRTTAYGDMTKFISPAFDLTSLTAPRLRFYFANTNWAGDIDELRVFYKTSSTGEWTQIGEDYTEEHTEWTEVILDLPNPSSEYYIAFEATSNWARGLDLDDVNVEETPSCVAPSDLELISTTTTTADILWSAGGDETEWEIVYGAPGFDPDSEGDTLTDDDGTAGTTIDGLTSQTEYEAYVRAVCGEDGESFWIGPLYFMTNCEAITSFPYIENFDEVTTPDLPSCWSYLDENAEGNTSNDIWQTYTGDGINDTQAAGLYTDGNGGDNDDYLVSPQFTLTGNEQVRFSVKVESEFEPNDFKVMLSTTGNDAASFTEELLPLTEVSNAEEYEQYTIDLDAYTGDVYIAIYVPSGGQDGWYLYVDKFIVRTIPTCPEPTDIAIDEITDVSANVTWTAGGDETEWTVVYGEPGFDPSTAGTENTVNVTGGTPEATIEGLTPETDYEVYVQANCGENDDSEWTGPESFYSWYCVSEPTSVDNDGITNVQLVDTDFPNDPVVYASFTDTPVDIYQDILTNVQISFATGYTYDTNIWIDFNDDFVFDESELVYSGESTNNNPTTLDASFTLLADTALGSHAMRIGAADGGQATPNPCYNGAYGVTLDFIVNILPGPCPPPSDITVNASDYYADVTWTENGDATAWTVVYGPVGFDPETEGTQVDVTGTPAVTLDGLDEETGYEVYVMSDCEIGAIWIGPVAFETIPNTCLMPSDIQINQIVGPTAEVTWVENGTATEWEIEYGPADFEPGTGAGTIVTDNDGTLGETLDGLDPETEYDVYVRAICEGDGTSNWAGPASFISDVSCPVPSNIYITGIDGDSVNVSWTENGLANEWEIEYGPVGFEQGQGTTVMDTDGEIGTTLTGLDVNTEYELYIRSVCGENETSLWFGPISFTTATTGLIAQSFDGFVFYPNPVNDQLNLKASAKIQKVEIYNLLGQQVIVHKSNDLKSTIDVTRLQAGAYLMKVTINGYAKTFKLVKQ